MSILTDFPNTYHLRFYGAIADGGEHPLSDVYGTLAEAQETFPEATSLADEIDLCAFLRCLELSQTERPFGGVIVMPKGSMRFNRAVDLSGCVCLRIVNEGAVGGGASTVDSHNNSGASRVVYTGAAGGAAFVVTLTQRVGYYANGIVFEGVDISASYDAGNACVRCTNWVPNMAFIGCYFGGADKPLHFATSGPSTAFGNVVMQRCTFGVGGDYNPPTSTGYRPNYGIYCDAGISWYGQLALNDCRFYDIQKSFVYAAGRMSMRLNGCSFVRNYTAPPIHLVPEITGADVSISNCLFDDVWRDAYWNGTNYQFSSGDTTRCAVIHATCGSFALTLRVADNTRLGMRVMLTSQQVYALLADGAGLRATMEVNPIAALERALVWRPSGAAAIQLTRLPGAAPTNGDLLVSGPTGTEQRWREVNAANLSAPPAGIWSPAVAAPLPPYGNVTWDPYTINCVRVLMNWNAAWQAPIYPYRARRDLFITNPGDLGAANFDNSHKNFTRTDILYMDTWRTGTAANIGYGTRFAMLCGKDATASNAASSFFPLVTGPGVSADKGNADGTWSYSTDETEMRYNTPLTANRTIGINLWSGTVPNGARARFTRGLAATGGFDLIFTVNSVEVFRLKYPGSWFELWCDGTNWHVLAAGRLSLDDDRVLEVVTSGGTTTDSSQYNAYVFTGATTHTLTMQPCSTNARKRIKNRSSGNVTINRAGSDVFNGVDTSIVLAPGTSIILVGSGTSWEQF